MSTRISAAEALPARGPLPYRLVIFDFDGTLADSIDWFEATLGVVSRRYGFAEVTRAEFDVLRGLDSRAVVRRLGLPGWKLPLAVRHMRRLAADAADGIALHPGVPAMLDRLAAAGIELAVVSSNDERNVRRILGPESVARILHFHCGAALFGKARTFRRLQRRSGLAPERVLAIGDEVRDIEAAHSAGLSSGAVTWGYAKPEVLAAQSPTLVFRRIEEIAAACLRA